jgi:alpha-N-acetylglucosamine transferase
MEYNGMKWNGTEWNNDSIPLFGYYMKYFHAIVWEVDGAEQVITFEFPFYPYLKI